jgi:hypothetical protein
LFIGVILLGHIDPPGRWKAFYIGDRWEDMSDSLKRVQSGEPLFIPASAYNAFIDAALDFRQRTAHLGQGV